MREWWESIYSTANHLWIHRRRIVARAHKDKRQRIALLVLLGATTYITFYSVYFYRYPGAAILLLLGTGVAAWIRRGHQKDDQSFPTLLQPIAPDEQSPTIHEEDRHQARTLGLWLLYRRALSELQLQQEAKVISGVITRSVLLSCMRKWQMEEHLTPQERDLHFQPDGAWSGEQVVAVISRGAELEALLWAAGIRASLCTIEDLNVVVSPQPLDLRKLDKRDLLKWRDTSEIRLESKLALFAWLRLHAELRNRGLDVPFSDDPELTRERTEASIGSGDQNLDIVLGIKLVTECTDAELRIAFEQLGMRASALLSLLSAKADPTSA